jgi:hypothetical protein
MLHADICTILRDYCEICGCMRRLSRIITHNNAIYRVIPICCGSTMQKLLINRRKYRTRDRYYEYYDNYGNHLFMNKYKYNLVYNNCRFEYHYHDNSIKIKIYINKDYYLSIKIFYDNNDNDYIMESHTKLLYNDRWIICYKNMQYCSDIYKITHNIINRMDFIKK